MIMLVWAFWPASPDTYYTDGVSVRLSEQDVNLRDVVWESPAPVFEDTSEEADMYDPAVSADDQLMIFVKGLPKQHPKDNGNGSELYFTTR